MYRPAKFPGGLRRKECLLPKLYAPPMFYAFGPKECKALKPTVMPQPNAASPMASKV